MNARTIVNGLAGVAAVYFTALAVIEWTDAGDLVYAQCSRCDSHEHDASMCPEARS